MPGLIILQVLVALVLIALILLQAKGGGLGTAFGGSAGVYHTKKGVERLVYMTTIILIIFLLGLALVNLKI